MISFQENNKKLYKLYILVFLKKIMLNIEQKK